MAGVIDGHGQQWERCNNCSAWVKIQDLVYEKPSLAFESGRDLCMNCASHMPTNTIDFHPVTVSVYTHKNRKHQSEW